MDLQYLILIAIGFAAQMVDGALGMAFGVIATSSLIATGVPPVIASAAVHAAEVVTTAISGASHVWNRNVDRRLVFKLVITGVCGGVFGAYVLTGLPENVIKPVVTVYLGAMAVLILARVLGWKLDRWRPSDTDRRSRRWLSGRDRGWRLGTAGGVDTDGVWQQSTPHDRLSKLGRVLRDVEHLSRLPDAAGFRALRRTRARTHHRGSDRSSARRLPLTHSADTLGVGAGWHRRCRAHPHELGEPSHAVASHPLMAAEG